MARRARTGCRSAVLLVILLVAGCSAAAGSSTQVVGERAVAVIDEKSGTIELPLDKYGITPREHRTVDYALDLLWRDCMRAKGLDFRVHDTRGIVEKPSRRYGIWRMDDAVRYGYQLPPDDPIVKQLQADNGLSFSPEYQSQLTTCQLTPAAKALWPSENGANGQSAKQAFLSYGDVIDSEPGKKVVSDWQSCLRDQGLAQPEDGKWISDNWFTADLETQIRIASLDVGCKQRVRVMQRLGDLEASAQMAIVKAHEAELASVRSAFLKSVTAAEAVIHSHGG
jgi:hypothetical protein